jgi:hypothetical protein
MATPPPPSSPKRREVDTIKRSRFFNAYNTKGKDTSLGQVCKTLDFHLLPSITRTWLRKRDFIRSNVVKRTRRLSFRLGRKSKVSAADVRRLIKPDDPIREKRWED